MSHGDFTTDNILADGEPPRIAGAIDFALARWTSAGAVDCSPTLERPRHIAAHPDELRAAVAALS